MLRLIDGGINGSPLLNPARLHAMYGVAAERYLEYAALRGDASDNLPGVSGIGEKTAAVLLEQAGSMQAVWADIDHNDGRALVAALDGWAEETGARRMGATVVRRLTAPGARERYDFNVRIMSGHDDLDLGLTPDVPGSPGCSRSTSTGSARSSASSTSRRPRRSRSACSAATRRRFQTPEPRAPYVIPPRTTWLSRPRGYPFAD